MSGATKRPVQMDLATWALLLTLSLLWGGSFFFTEIALLELPPLTIVLARVGLAALALHLVLLARGLRLPLERNLLGGFLIMGALNNVIPFSLIVWGQTEVTSGLAAILNATTPLWAVLLAHFLTADERLTWNRLLGVLLGLSGVALMVGASALRGLEGDLTAQAAILLAALSYAVAGLFGRRFRSLDPMITASGQVSASTLLILPLVLLVDTPWRLAMPSDATWSALAGFALLSTALAYILYFRILRGAGATNLLLVTFLIPVSAILLGVGVLGEVLAARELLGMGLIGMGLAAVDGRLLGRFRRPAAGTSAATRPL